MIHAIAIDDEPPALSVIENFCSRTDFIRLTKTFTQPAEAAKHLRRFPVDLVFLDIQMPSVSGLEFSGKLGPGIMVIFTTAYSEYAIEGFNLDAVDYLLKPFSFERFTKAVQKARDYYQYTHLLPQTKPYIFIRADYTLVKIFLDDILFIEGLDDYLKIHIHEHKPVVTRMTMKTLLDKLPTGMFTRVHRSFIVPVDKIEQIRNQVLTVAGHEIPIGNSYKNNLPDDLG